MQSCCSSFVQKFIPLCHFVPTFLPIIRAIILELPFLVSNLMQCTNKNLEPYICAHLCMILKNFWWAHEYFFPLPFYHLGEKKIHSRSLNPLYGANVQFAIDCWACSNPFHITKLVQLAKATSSIGNKIE